MHSHISTQSCTDPCKHRPPLPCTCQERGFVLPPAPRVALGPLSAATKLAPCTQRKGSCKMPLYSPARATASRFPAAPPRGWARYACMRVSLRWGRHVDGMSSPSSICIRVDLLFGAWLSRIQPALCLCIMLLLLRETEQVVALKFWLFRAKTTLSAGFCMQSSGSGILAQAASHTVFSSGVFPPSPPARDMAHLVYVLLALQHSINTKHTKKQQRRTCALRAQRGKNLASIQGDAQMETRHRRFDTH